MQIPFLVLLDSSSLRKPVHSGDGVYPSAIFSGEEAAGEGAVGVVADPVVS